MKVYEYISRKASAYNNANSEWKERHEEDINKLLSETAPSGSGFDNGTRFDWNCVINSRKKLVFNTDFHHMDQSGMYCKWTSHNVTITPTFSDFDITVSGSNYNDIKDYITQVFHDWLMSSIDGKIRSE